MKIKVSLRLAGKDALDEVLEIDDSKLEELTEEELDHAVEIVIRTWADRQIEIAWETIE